MSAGRTEERIRDFSQVSGKTAGIRGSRNQIRKSKKNKKSVTGKAVREENTGCWNAEM